jgi:hypothetical protein
LREKITTPEGITSTLHRPVAIHGTAILLPKHTVAVRLFDKADAVEPADVDLAAVTLQEGPAIQPCGVG